MKTTAYLAAADSHVGAGEQGRVQHAENAQSGRIYTKKHNVGVK